MNTDTAIIIAQSAKNTTDYVSETVYTFLEMGSMYEDYAQIEEDYEMGMLSKGSAGAHKANITRRISYEVWLNLHGVPFWVLLNRRQGQEELYATPHRLAAKLIGHAPQPLKGDVLNARLLRKPDPKPAAKKPVAQKLIAAPTPAPVATPATAPAPAPTTTAVAVSVSVSERQRAAAFKAWATRRARAVAA